MNVTNKQLRKLTLYKQVAKLKGARVAKKLKDAIAYDLADIRANDTLMRLFVWSNTKEGHHYWSKLNRKIRQNS